jgi:hypothetical protein
MGWRHLRELGPAEIPAFLTHLAAVGQVAASTQNQALNALLFLYREVLHLERAGRILSGIRSSCTRARGTPA